MLESRLGAGCAAGLPSAVQLWASPSGSRSGGSTGRATTDADRSEAHSHQLSEAEKDDIVRLADTPQCRNLRPEQVVARLADGVLTVLRPSRHNAFVKLELPGGRRKERCSGQCWVSDFKQVSAAPSCRQP